MKKREPERQIDELRQEVESLKARIKVLELGAVYPNWTQPLYPLDLTTPRYGQRDPLPVWTGASCTCGKYYTSGGPLACPVHGTQWWTYTR